MESFWWCPVIGVETIGKSWNSRGSLWTSRNNVFTDGDWPLAQFVQRRCKEAVWFSLLEILKSCLDTVLSILCYVTLLDQECGPDDLLRCLPTSSIVFLWLSEFEWANSHKLWLQGFKWGIRMTFPPGGQPRSGTSSHILRLWIFPVCRDFQDQTGHSTRQPRIIELLRSLSPTFDWSPPHQLEHSTKSSNFLNTSRNGESTLLLAGHSNI